MKTNTKNIIKEKNKRELLERRLDSLAWLLEGDSMCAAVSVINGNMCVSSNDLFDGTTRANKKLNRIIEIMKYFKSVAIEELNGEDRKLKRDELMASISKKQISIAGFDRTVIWDDIIERVVNSDVLSKSSPFSSDVHNESIKYLKKHIEKTYTAFGHGKKLYKAFLKIEKSIEGDKVEKKFSKLQIKVFKDFEHEKLEKNKIKNIESNILFLPKDEGKNIHAEMQILDKIIKMLEKNLIASRETIYIGTSKKCCLNCRILLDISREEVFEKYKVVIKFGGAHDQSCKSKWGQPPFLKAGNNRLTRRIRNRYFKEINKKSITVESKSLQDDRFFWDLQEEDYEKHKKSKMDEHMGSVLELCHPEFKEEIQNQVKRKNEAGDLENKPNKKFKGSK